MAQIIKPHVAGIILAAGEARRFGAPKALLEWRGEPFIRHIAQTALAAGLSPLVAVGGAYPGLFEETLKDLPVLIVHNAHWKNGQSSSVQLGLRNLPLETDAAIFLLVDQPQVPGELLRLLVEKYAQTRAEIIAPRVGGRRANPVLFDRRTFGELMTLQGDTGGRALFGSHEVLDIPWQDPTLLLDVDTPEDYQRLCKISINS